MHTMHASLGLPVPARLGSLRHMQLPGLQQRGVTRPLPCRQQQQQQQLRLRAQRPERVELDTQQAADADLLPAAAAANKQQQPQQPKQQQQQPDPQQRRPGPLRWLRRNVSRLPFFAKAEEGQGARLNLRALLQQLRVLILGCMFGCVLLVVRYATLHQARTAPREVLYSDFVTLLSTGKVKAARLEASSSKLMFELHPQEAAAAAAKPAAPASGKGSAAAATAAAASAAAGTAAAAAPAPHRRFFIKLADKQDPLLVGKVLQAGGWVGVRVTGVGWQLHLAR